MYFCQAAPNHQGLLAGGTMGALCTHLGCEESGFNATALPSPPGGCI